jgi:hypothetical protein
LAGAWPTSPAAVPSSAGPAASTGPTLNPLKVNSSYFDEGGQWNCGQGHETFAFFGDASGGAAPYRYSWNYGDGTPNASSTDPVHTYLGLGPYVAEVTVLDSSNASAHATLTVQWTISLDCVDPSPINWAGVVMDGLLLVGAVALIGWVWRWRRRLPP